MPGGPKVNLTGTVQEVVGQLKELNSDYGTYFNNTKAIVEASIIQQQEKNKRMTSLNKRAVRCGGLGNAQKVYIQDGIAHLRTVGGRPSNGPGPNNCGRVSCSQNSAIWWCNDNDGTKALGSFNNIADSAQLILNDCFKSGALLGGGQETHSDNWRGLVKEDQC